MKFYNQFKTLSEVGRMKKSKSERYSCCARLIDNQCFCHLPFRGHANSLFVFQRWMAVKCWLAAWGSKRAKTSSRPWDLLMTWKDRDTRLVSFSLIQLTARNCQNWKCDAVKDIWNCWLGNSNFGWTIPFLFFDNLSTISRYLSLDIVLRLLTILLCLQ